MEKLKQRLKEPSTYAGLGLLTLGLGQIFKLDHTEEVAGIMKSAGTSIATGDYTTAALVTFTGLAALFVKGKGQ